MAKLYVPVFFDWLETTQDLSAEEKGHLIDAVIMYASGTGDWERQLQTSGERIAFRFLKGQVDRNNEISAVRSRAGSSKAEQKEAKANKPEQTETKASKTEKRFTQPTLEEVTAYCRERQNGIDPQRFIDFYASKGWKVGNQPMKDWKACVRTWEQREGSRNDGKRASNTDAQGTVRGDYSFLRQA